MGFSVIALIGVVYVTSERDNLLFPRKTIQRKLSMITQVRTIMSKAPIGISLRKISTLLLIPSTLAGTCDLPQNYSKYFIEALNDLEETAIAKIMDANAYLLSKS